MGASEEPIRIRRDLLARNTAIAVEIVAIVGFGVALCVFIAERRPPSLLDLAFDAAVAAIILWMIARAFCDVFQRALLWPDRLEVYSGCAGAVVPRDGIVAIRRHVGDARRVNVETADGRTVVLEPFVHANDDARSWLIAAVRDASWTSLPPVPRRVRRLARALDATGFAAALWLFLYPYPYIWAVAAACAVPPVAFAFDLAFPLAFADFFRNENRLASLEGLYLFAPLILAFRSFIDIDFYDPVSAIPATLVGACALAAVAAFASPKIRTQRETWTALFALATLYSFGVLAQLDTLPDNTRPAVYRAQLIRKEIVRGRRTTYYLHPAPWGPDGRAGRIAVDPDLYDATREGDRFCIYLRPGFLGLRWYHPGRCQPATQEAP
jgi:hypothetical protein